MTTDANLEWKREPFRHAPGYIWRLYAPAPVVAAIGGAPCHAHIEGLIGTLSRDGRTWGARIELTPYDTAKASGGREHTAKARTEAMIAEHMNALGFAVSFSESAS